MRAIASLAAAFAMTVSAASAMTVDPSLGQDSPAIAHVAYGCGIGMTRGPYGHCRPKFTCPRGWHSGPAGFHCFRNRW